MAKLKIAQVTDDILPCPFCGAYPIARLNPTPDVFCGTNACPASYVRVPTSTWQTRSIPDLKQAYTQFEESIKAERVKTEETKNKTDKLVFLILKELSGGTFIDGIPLGRSHTVAINELIAMAKEYMNA